MTSTNTFGFGVESALGTAVPSQPARDHRFTSARERELNETGRLARNLSFRDELAEFAPDDPDYYVDPVAWVDELLASRAMQAIRAALIHAGKVMDADYGPTPGKHGWAQHLEIEDEQLLAWIIGTAAEPADLAPLREAVRSVRAVLAVEHARLNITEA